MYIGIGAGVFVVLAVLALVILFRARSGRFRSSSDWSDERVRQSLSFDEPDLVPEQTTYDGGMEEPTITDPMEPIDSTEQISLDFISDFL
jgi:hypothetical protein